MRRIGGIAVALALFGAGPLAAQYFGQNKVQYQAFDFHIIQTEHFEIYYYPAERTAALDAARMAERWYARLSRVLHHQFQARKPIILYASQSDFQQTNTTSEDLGEGTGGFTEFFKHRMVLPFTGTYAELEHVLGHEMVHQFQYDVISRGHIGAGVQTLVNANLPGWFMEGMAEYLSIGPIDPLTSMWLRDASLEGHLPTIEEMTFDPRIFPYRFGHALMAYVGEKWGDEAIGQVLQASVAAGVDGGFKRALGITLDDLSSEWRDAIQTTFLPQLADHYRARRIAQPLLTERRSEGTLHLAPALSPDGHYIAYFSEKNSFFVDLYLADAETGRVIRRLVKSTLNSNYESLRFINSAGSFSPDGRYFAIAAKHKDRDDLVLLDVKKDEELRRIRIPFNGLTTPSWSPDGSRIVFTGYDGGLSDLFIVNTDGTGLQRLTHDKYADLEPSWSPDGKTIAFVTDRGPATDFTTLKFGNLRIALFHLQDGSIELLRHMDQGKNIDPVWAPDGRSLAFVSDRTGISNIFLYDLTDTNIYQLTDVFSGVSGITALSPCLSWAHEADRLAFAYYEDGEYNVYAVDNPRSLKREPYEGPKTPPVTSLMAALRRGLPSVSTSTNTVAAAVVRADPALRGRTSVYRTPSGFRASGAPPQAGDSGSAAPVTVKDLLDSSPALPDTTEFTLKNYSTRFSPDYVARPTVGYARDNFGSGVYGGTAITLSDILGNHSLLFSLAINGRISEAQALAAYINQAHRLNWVLGASQQPVYFYLPTTVQANPSDPSGNTFIVTPRLARYVIRDAFAQTFYPFDRFTRLEFGSHISNMTQGVQQQQYLTDAFGNVLAVSDPVTIDGPSLTYFGPQVGLVHDNSLFGFVGPFSGSRWRLEASPSFGNWQFLGAVVDWRRYLFARPFTIAIRTAMYGRFGRDGDQFPLFLGNTDLLRGYTSGSIINHECVQRQSGGTCPELDQLSGSRIAVANAELRFPLTRSLILGFLPVGLPPIEGAIFYDAGIAWYSFSNIKWDRSPLWADQAQSAILRAPLRSWGASIRLNALGFVILRFDYTKPLSRPHDTAYWTVSLGPTF